jgi:hypothetical protein
MFVGGMISVKTEPTSVPNAEILQTSPVYRPIGAILTIEGRNMHEAYLVVTDTHMLIGFYLPGKSSLSRLPASVQLPVEENP